MAQQSEHSPTYPYSPLIREQALELMAQGKSIQEVSQKLYVRRMDILRAWWEEAHPGLPPPEDRPQPTLNDWNKLAAQVADLARRYKQLTARLDAIDMEKG